MDGIQDSPVSVGVGGENSADCRYRGGIVGWRIRSIPALRRGATTAVREHRANSE